MNPLIVLAQFLFYSVFLMALISVVMVAYLRFSRQMRHLWPVVWRRCRSRSRARVVAFFGVAPLGCYMLLSMANLHWGIIEVSERVNHLLISVMLAAAWVAMFAIWTAVWAECTWRASVILWTPRRDPML